MIQSITFNSFRSGIKFLVLGAIHGNEKCGTFAIRRIISEIENRDIVIENGAVTFVPICNPRAFNADTRFVERNLNRFLVPQINPDCYEAQIGNILCPLLEECDVLLDLHSYSVGGAAFVFIGEPHSKEHLYANSLGAAAVLTGWQTAYAVSGKLQTAIDPEESVGTTEYARRFGAIGVTLECGQHKAAESPEIAYQAIRNAFNYLRMASLPLPKAINQGSSKLIEVKRVFYRGNGGVFTKAWQHLEPVTKGDVIAKNEKGESVAIPDNGYLILPHADASFGSEWFYWGQQLN